jgi:uncharacterized DUF497 family protein
MIKMEIAWDRYKAQSNLQKHGVSFDEASTVLCDTIAETFLDDANNGEERFITMGHSAVGRLLLVVWSEKADGNIRIISARRATKRERSEYEKGIRT